MDAIPPAYAAVIEMINQMLTLAIGVTGVTATFVTVDQKSRIPFGRVSLLVSWVALLISCLCGIFAHGAVAGALNETNIRPSIYGGSVQTYVFLQLVFLLIGFTVLMVAGFRRLMRKPPQDSTDSV